MSNLNSNYVLIVAGEASGDLHGANLVRAMNDLDPDICFHGVGGGRMASAGVDILAHSSEMAVVGFTEVFSKLKTISRAYINLRSILKNERPDLLILIDYPGFNIKLAGAAKKFGIPVLYYISPQLWAWRSGRAKKISERVDKMSVILPFEKDFYKKMGTDLSVEYVGHPLLDQVPVKLNGAGIRQNLGLSEEDNIIGLLPGSRDEEIKNLLPDMVKAAEIIAAGVKNLKCVLPVAATISTELINNIIQNSPLEIIPVYKGVYYALRVCDFAFVASGTATLETAIMGVPMIITYRISPISFQIAKWVANVQYAGLVNLVAGKEVAPELLQKEVNPDNMAARAMEILGDKEKISSIKKNLENVRKSLGSPGASARTARIAIEMMKGY
ncbi:lipid-A-disaccharide synthase [Thermodesulfobacteriota bacterium]